jgi:hypothetical protein
LPRLAVITLEAGAAVVVLGVDTGAADIAGALVVSAGVAALAVGAVLALIAFVAPATGCATAVLGVAELGCTAAVVTGGAAAVTLGGRAGWLGAEFPVAICAFSAIESPGAGVTPACGFCSGVVQRPPLGADVCGLGWLMDNDDDGCDGRVAAASAGAACLRFLPCEEIEAVSPLRISRLRACIWHMATKSETEVTSRIPTMMLALTSPPEAVV